MNTPDAARAQLDHKEKLARNADLSQRLATARKMHFKTQRARLDALGERKAALHAAVHEAGDRRIHILYKLKEEKSGLVALESQGIKPDSPEFTEQQAAVTELQERFNKLEAEHQARTSAWADASRLYDACEKWLSSAEDAFNKDWLSNQ